MHQSFFYGPWTAFDYRAVLIPLGVLVTTAVIVYLALQNARHQRELLNRERLAAIAKGSDLPYLQTPRRRTEHPLASALTLLAVGLGLAFALYLLMPRAGTWGFGIMLALIGLGRLLFWFGGGRSEWERQRALDDELERAYIERLRTSARPAAVDAAPGAVRGSE